MVPFCHVGKFIAVFNFYLEGFFGGGNTSSSDETTEPAENVPPRTLKPLLHPAPRSRQGLPLEMETHLRLPPRRKGLLDREHLSSEYLVKFIHP